MISGRGPDDLPEEMERTSGSGELKHERDRSTLREGASDLEEGGVTADVLEQAPKAVGPEGEVNRALTSKRGSLRRSSTAYRTLTTTRVTSSAGLASPRKPSTSATSRAPTSTAGSAAWASTWAMSRARP
jgi:hypothetical protein